ncbi:MAG TPA: hypothetical protein VJ652_20475 [Noviherbaspirillum sp.]|nr:hypothetical protein [Noviherbaspirillum sp.]
MTNTPKDGPFHPLPFLTGDAPEVELPSPLNLDPGRMLDLLIARLQLPGDAMLAQRLEVTPTIIRMIREEKLAVSPSMMLRWAHATTGLPLEELRELAKNG